jgi:tetratricopeptide (TPR) repeat protein
MALLMVLAAGPRALAAPAAASSEAEALIRQGIALRKQGKDLEALERFQKAQLLAPSGRALSQRGLAQQALGRWVEAESDLSTALGSAADEWVQRNRASLERALGVVRGRLGTVEVIGSPAGAELRINGQSRGTLPLTAPLRVPEGSAVLELTSAGHVPQARTVLVVAGKLHRETMNLTPVPRLDVAAPAPAPPAAAPPSPEELTSRSRLRVLGWVSLGVGAGLLGAGVAGVVLREQSAQKFNSDACVGNGKTRAENCGGDLSQAQTTERLAIGAFVAGGVLSVGSAVLLIWEARTRRRADAAASSRPGPTLAWRCGAGPGHVGVSCGARF